MTDRELEHLLDEALTPPPPRAGLTDRVIAASEPVVRRGAARSVVIGRLGEKVSALAAAAVIALVMMGAWAMRDGQQPVAPPQSAGASHSLAALEQELSKLEQATTATPAPVAEQIELLELHVEMAVADPLWPGAADPLAEAGAQAQMYSLVSESMWRF